MKNSFFVGKMLALISIIFSLLVFIVSSMLMAGFSSGGFTVDSTNRMDNKSALYSCIATFIPLIVNIGYARTKKEQILGFILTCLCFIIYFYIWTGFIDSNDEGSFLLIFSFSAFFLAIPLKLFLYFSLKEKSDRPKNLFSICNIMSNIFIFLLFLFLFMFYIMLYSAFKERQITNIFQIFMTEITIFGLPYFVPLFINIKYGKNILEKCIGIILLIINFQISDFLGGKYLSNSEFNTYDRENWLSSSIYIFILFCTTTSIALLAKKYCSKIKFKNGRLFLDGS